LLKDLIGDEDELAHRIMKLADTAGLDERLNTVLMSATAGLPPAVADLLKKENPEWPADAVMFVLLVWLRLGLRKLLEAFNLIEESAPYAGEFKLRDLIGIIGLDVPLDDETLKSLKGALSKVAHAAH
jgi:hypothetical protein